MKLSSIAPVAALGSAQLPMSIAPAEAAPVPPTAAQIIATRYGRDLLAFPGAMTVAAALTTPNEVRITMADNASAALAAGVIERVIDGVKLVFIDQKTKLPFSGSEQGNSTDRMRAIEAMQGVWGRDWSLVKRPDQQPDTRGTVTFKTIDEANAKRLDLLVRDRFVEGVNSKTGKPIYIDVKWQAGISPK